MAGFRWQAYGLIIQPRRNTTRDASEEALFKVTLQRDALARGKLIFSDKLALTPR